VCEELEDLRAGFSSFARDFDIEALAPESLAGALEALGAVEKTAALLGAMVAARLGRLAGTVAARKQAARELARTSGTSLKEAARALATAGVLASQPVLDAAARSGGLSRPQAEIVSGAAAANPAATASLLAAARSGTMSELAYLAAQAKAAVSDPETMRQEVRRGRSLSSYTDASGTWHLHAKGLPEDGARVMAALQPLADRAFEEAWAKGPREGAAAYLFDGLVSLATSGGGGKATTEVVFRVDAEAFFRGYPLDGEVLEVAGFGPTSAEAVADVLEHGSPFLKAIITKGKDVAGVVHLGRRPNAYQQTALDWMYPTCAAKGCGVRSASCETDHREPWASTHFTLLELLDRLCREHHRLKTDEGWSLVEGKGKRPFVPPSDPRHPRAGRG